jgi:hypothetical protein
MAAFNNLDSLKTWFMDNGRGDTPAPYWTLYTGDYGANEKIAKFNDRVQDMSASFDMLARTIMDLNNPVGVRFRIAQGVKPRDNMPVAQVHVQLFNQTGGQQLPAVAGIAGLADGYVSKADLSEAVAKAVSVEKEKWEMKAQINRLEEQINNPTDSMDKIVAFLEKFAESPVGTMLIARVAGIPLGDIPAAVAGPHHDGGHTGAANDEEQLNNDLDILEETTGLTATELVKRLRVFAVSNPEMAKTLLRQV